MTEQEIASRVVKWLQSQHWDVYQEVQIWQHANITDIVAVRSGICMAVEVKRTLGLSVLNQAFRGSGNFHYSSIAVPECLHKNNQPGRDFAYRICRDYGIGLIEVDHFEPRQRIAPQLRRSNHQYAKRTISLLHEGHKTHAMAGSANGGHWTPYRQTMDDVRRIIEKFGPCNYKTIMQNLKDHHYSSDTSAKSAIRQALNKWETDWCHIEFIGNRNIYSIKEQP